MALVWGVLVGRGIEVPEGRRLVAERGKAEQKDVGARQRSV